MALKAVVCVIIDPEDMAKKAHQLGSIIDLYVGMLHKAIRTAWQHPELWVVGALAGLASTGAAFNHLFKSLWRIQPADQVTLADLSQALDLVPWVLTYADHLVLLPAWRLAAVVIAWIVVIAAGALIVVGAQHIVLTAVHRRHARKKPMGLRSQIAALKHWHFWRILGVDLLMYLASVILIGLASLALAALLTQSYGINTLVYIAVYALLIPLAFAVNVVGMLTLIRMVAKEQGILEAAAHSIRILRHHWLAAIETSILLFFANLIGTVALLLAILLFAGVVGIIAIGAVTAGSYLLMASIVFLGVLGGVFIVIAYGGFMTTVNYSVWTQLEDRLERFGLIPLLEHIVRKVI